MWASNGTCLRVCMSTSLLHLLWLHQWKSDLKDAVKVSDSEEVSDQDTDSDVVEYEESSFCCILIMYVFRSAI